MFNLNSDAYEKGYRDGLNGRSHTQGRAEVGGQKKKVEDYDRGYMKGTMERLAQ